MHVLSSWDIMVALIPGFPWRDFANSRDPGIFRDGISLKFLSWDFTKKKSIGSLGISLSAHFGQFHTFWRTYLFVKYIRQTKVSSIPSCGKQQEQEGVHWTLFNVTGNVVTQKRACLTPEKVEACGIFKSNLGLFWDMGFQNRWEVNVWLIDWFLFASLNQWLLYWLHKKTEV